MGGIPSQYTVDLDLVSPVDLTGIPSSFEITSLPKIQIGMDTITVNPLDVSVRIKEVPSLRTHVPAHYTVGFSLFGFQLASIQVCGESQVITEPYVPNPCERCDEAAIVSSAFAAVAAEPSMLAPFPTQRTRARSRARKKR